MKFDLASQTKMGSFSFRQDQLSQKKFCEIKEITIDEDDKEVSIEKIPTQRSSEAKLL